jgi:hypothetical protein
MSAALLALVVRGRGACGFVILAARAGRVPAYGASFVFLATGPMQEVALSSGWGDAFIALADRCGAALDALARQAAFACGGLRGVGCARTRVRDCRIWRPWRSIRQLRMSDVP